MAVGPGGVVYIADDLNRRVRRIDGSGDIATVAGTGQEGFGGDGGQATAAQLSRPAGLALDASGNLYIADSGNHRIRKVDAGGVITTVAGVGAATAVPWSTTAATEGRPHWRSRTIPVTSCWMEAEASTSPTRSTGSSARSTIGHHQHGCRRAPGPPVRGRRRPGHPRFAELPPGCRRRRIGNLYISDNGNHRVRRADAAGITTTVAGSGPVSEETGDAGYGGDGGPAEQAKLHYPGHVDVDAGATSGSLTPATAGCGEPAPTCSPCAPPTRPTPSGSATPSATRSRWASRRRSPASRSRARHPPGAFFRAAVPSQGSCSYGGGTVTCTLGDLGPSASAATVRIDVTAPNHGGELVNTATVTSAGSDPDPADDTVTERTTVAAPPGSGLAMTMADFPGPVRASGSRSPTTWPLATAARRPTPGSASMIRFPPA